MKRRTAIQSMGVAASHVLFPSILAGFITGCKDPEEYRTAYSLLFFNEEEMDLLTQIIDIIIPKTSTASASEVNTHLFLDEVFAKCMDKEVQNKIRNGLRAISDLFMDKDDKDGFIQEIDTKAFGGDQEFSWFITLKQYTLVGFFTSQEGMTRASNYVKFPGDYIGEIEADEETLNYGKTDLRYYL